MKLVENPQVTHLTYYLFKATMQTPEQNVESVQTSEAYFEPLQILDFVC